MASAPSNGSSSKHTIVKLETSTTSMEVHDESLLKPPTSPEAALAWHAARTESPHVVVAGIKVQDPVAIPAHPISRPVAHPSSTLPLGSQTTPNVVSSNTAAVQPSHPATPPPSGFVLTGTIALFGDASLPAKFEVWEGPPPADVAAPPPSGPASVERATLPGPITLSSLFAKLRNTNIGSIAFKNVSILHQTYQFDRTRSVGWHLDAEMIIDERCGALHGALVTISGSPSQSESKGKELNASVHADLDAPAGWAHPLDIRELLLEGLLTLTDSRPPFSGLTFTKVGVRLRVSRPPSPPEHPEHAHVLSSQDDLFDFMIDGVLTITTPGSALPIKLDCEIREQMGKVELSAKCESWDTPLGVKGLVLRDALFTCQLPLEETVQDTVPISFNISASLTYGAASAVFSGSYVPSIPNSFELKATIHDFSTNTLSVLFTSLTGKSLSLPSLPIGFTSASLHLGVQPQKGFGLTVTLDRVTVGPHTCLDASLEITSRDAVVQGTLISPTVTLQGAEVKNAHLRIDLVSQTDNNRAVGERKTQITLGGNAVFSELALDVTVYLYSSSDSSEDNGRLGKQGVAGAISDALQWTIVSVVGDTLSLSKIIPQVHGTFLDLALKHVVFVAASRDNPEIGNIITGGYRYHKGIQVCATLDDLGPLNSLVRSHISGLTLTISYSETHGFRLDIIPPTTTFLSLGHGITTSSLKPSIQTSPPRLTVSTDITVPLPHSDQPLIFDLVLSADLIGASGSSMVDGWWINPLGAGTNVKVGPKLMLSLDIVFAQFVTTGSISGLGVQGGMMIGDTEVQASLNVNENPLKEFLQADANSLNMVDIISFTQDVTGLWMPVPPREFMTFEHLKLYICPADIVLGERVCPAGCSFTADMLIFGRKADVSCEIKPTELCLNGRVDNFELGPLKLSGQSSPQASVSLAFGASVQQMLIDGKLTLFSDEVAAHVDIMIGPQPKLSWFALLKFNDLFTFQLNAQLVGALNLADLSNVDFTFDALLQQDILQHISAHLLTQLEQACYVANEGLQQAQRRLDDLQNTYDKQLKAAEANLMRSHAAWLDKDNSTRKTYQSSIDIYDAAIFRLREDVQTKRREYDAALNKAKDAMITASRERELRIVTAQKDVESAERKLDTDVRNAQTTLDHAQANMERDFGTAQQDLVKARQNVQTISNQINHIYDTIRQYERAPPYEFWMKTALPGLYTNVGALEASKAVADGVLEAAEEVISSVLYTTQEDNIRLARLALDQAKADGEALLETARRLLHEIDLTTQAATSESEKVWEDAQKGIEWLAFQSAISTLDAYRTAHDESRKEAQAAIEGLDRSVEYLTYQSAIAALAVVRSSTLDLEAAQRALSVAEATTKETVSIGKWISAHLSSDLVDIRLVHITGLLSEVVGHQTGTVVPLNAHIEGFVARRSFSFNCQFDPGRISVFMSEIFERVWDEIGKFV